MCLTNIEKITPQEDIVCYKVFKVNRKELDSDLLSPCQDKKWKLGRTETLRRIEPIRYANHIRTKILLIYQLSFYTVLNLLFVNVLFLKTPNMFIRG